jgi:hypothetical protein
MKKVIRLTESDLKEIIYRVINEERFDNLQDYIVELEVIVNQMESLEPGSDELYDMLGQVKQLARMAEFNEDMSQDEKDDFFDMVDDVLSSYE